MKIAVLSDIHANLPAFEAVAAHIESWGADEVVIAGDLVNRGPRPLECFRFFQEKQRAQGWRALLGNHEAYVLKWLKPGAPRSGPKFEVHKASHWTFQQLGEAIHEVAALPKQISLPGPDGREIRFVHGSMIGDRDGIYPETSDHELAGKISPGGRTVARPALFAVGHTHRPLVRSLNGTLVVNAGSAGLPFDQDTRPSYAQITWRSGRWSAEIVRIDYDIQRAERDFEQTGFDPDAGPLVKLVRIELQQGSSQLFCWAARYQQSALAGEITMEQAVSRYLGEDG